MSLKENSRLLILASVDRGETQVKEAARLLKISTRQLRRQLHRLRTQGARGLVHGNRDREPANALAPDLRRQILDLLVTRYSDLNNQHVASLLARDHDVHVSRMTVSRIRQEAGLPTPVRRRAPKSHRQRERVSQPGLLVQIDGCFHHWFGDNVSPCCLLAAIDDATGTVLAAVFCEQETIFGYMLLLRQLVERYGIPAAVYSDRHTIHVSPKYSVPDIQQQLQGISPQTHFGLCLNMLGIAQVLAYSPEAKGRIERLFLTLQDRLVKELRLAGISDIPAATAFLPAFFDAFNAEFSVAPANPVPAFRPVPASLNLDYVFSIKQERIVQADNTVRFDGHSLQIPGPRSYAKARVQVCSLPDGTFAIAHKATFIAGPSLLQTLLAPPRPTASRPEPAPRRSTAHTPAPNHPWRRPFKIPVSVAAAKDDDS